MLRNIERFHRAIKEVRNIERFQVHNENYIFRAIKAYVKLEFMRLNKEISYWHQVKKELYVNVIFEYTTDLSKMMLLSMHKSYSCEYTRSVLILGR